MERIVGKKGKAKMEEMGRERRSETWGKRGFLFTLDAALGVIIAFLVVGTSIYFLTRGSESALPDYQMLSLGSDIVAILDEREVLDSLNPSLIETEMEALLPVQYGMLIRLQGNISQGSGTMEAGQEIPVGVSTFSGQRIALTNQDTYLLVTYSMWVKQQE